MDPAAFGGAGCFVRQTGFIAAACRNNPPVAGVPLYPGTMDALVTWAERFEVVPPVPTH
jgi:hypothetical protein